VGNTAADAETEVLVSSNPDFDQPMAAVDLGSNSFQVLVAEYSHGQLRVVDRLREMVRLAAGLDSSNSLDSASQKRALECLARFGERLRDIPPERVSAVGTNTLRKARNPAEFMQQAESLLGHEIDIISGIEEARLIYAGVSRTLPEIDGEQLIIDIGGGSTELAGGTGYQPHTLESLYMGCVGMSRRFFDGGKITQEGFNGARTAARLELLPVAERYRRTQWERAAGASGTIRAAANVLAAMGFIDRNITPDALEKLIAEMVRQGHVENYDLPTLSEQRAPVFAGGIAVLVETMKELGIPELEVTQGALREGLLYDLVGRSSEEDSRVRTVRAMELRYHVDTDQADRVEQTANLLLSQVAADWQLDQPAIKQTLEWSARLHEIGLDIAHSHYHQHSAYLLEHSDMPGFHINEQRTLASIVGSHRRKLSTKNITAEAPKGWANHAARLTILLRLAVLLNRSRAHELPGMLELSADSNRLTLKLDADWLQANPLTLADIEREQDFLKSSGYEFKLETAS